MKRSCILLPTVLLFLCWGTADQRFLVTKAERFFILSNDHVLAQTDREKTEDISQIANQEEDLSQLLATIRRLFISRASLGGFLGAFLAWLASHFVTITHFNLAAASSRQIVAKAVYFHIGGILTGALSYEAIRIFYPNKKPPALIVGVIAGVGWPLIGLLAIGILKDIISRVRAAFMAAGKAFFGEPTTDAPPPNKTEPNDEDNPHEE